MNAPSIFLVPSNHLSSFRTRAVCNRCTPPTTTREYLNGRVQIVIADMVAQVHLRVRLGHPHHRLDVPHRDGDTPRSGGFAPQVRVKLRQLALVDALAREV